MWRMWVLTVLVEYSSAAISLADRLLGRYRSTRSSLPLSSSARACGLLARTAGAEP